MADLRDILYGVPLRETIGLTDRTIARVSLDSREEGPDGLFAALRGTKVDGHDFIGQAELNGATAVLCEHIPPSPRQGVTYLRVDDPAEALGAIASNFHGRPSGKLRLVGVTGTNGKTTVVTLLHRLFGALGYAAGLISTVRNRIGERAAPATHTTPDAVRLNALLAEMAEAGCEQVFMEVSSHAVDQRRIAGLEFAVGVFTNLTHDHLDYHGDFKSYRDAKKRFFDGLATDASAVVNADDRNGGVMLQNTAAAQRTYALRGPADYRARILENGFGGLVMDLDGVEFHALLIGEFNAYNLLAAYAAARELGAEREDVLRELSGLRAAEGRFEPLRGKASGITAILDYAHTPDALEKVLTTIRQVRAGSGRVITVVGCGGDRDKAKRPVMARVAAELSDRTVLTSDNPRSEDPEAILRDMQEGVPPAKRAAVLTVTDRREAIRAACQLAGRGDIVLVAGKGHEKYQEIGGRRLPFDDKAVLEETLNPPPA